MNLANDVSSFIQHLPEDGQKSLKHVCGLPYDCTLLYLTAVQLLD